MTTDAASPAALSTERLCRSFGALQVANDIAFVLPHGARHALIGPNGAGKSTLLNLMTGALEPSSGRVLLNGVDVTALPAEARVKRGLVRTFQINTLFPEMTPMQATTLAVSERLGFGHRVLRAMSSCRQAIDEAYVILERLGLAGDARRPTRELAYGRQRLVEIALALASQPRVLLLDEPAAGVPAKESAELFAALAELPRDIAVLFIEHDMELVFRFAERITVLVSGRILREGTPAEIAADPLVREVYLGSGHV
jgi:ABC-type branched-subunit amino acid transport system ATPase component